MSRGVYEVCGKTLLIRIRRVMNDMIHPGTRSWTASDSRHDICHVMGVASADLVCNAQMTVRPNALGFLVVLKCLY